MILDKELLFYWIKWKWLELFEHPEHKYFWIKHAYKTRKRDLLIEKRTKEIEDKYKAMFCSLDLDWTGYLHLTSLKKKEIDTLRK